MASKSGGGGLLADSMAKVLRPASKEGHVLASGSPDMWEEHLLEQNLMYNPLKW